MKENIVQSKSYKFAVRIVNFYRLMIQQKREYELSKQVLRCGTSIGANVEEAMGAQSRKDFLSKMSIAYKEARETSFWLKLLNDTDIISKKEFESLNSDCEELLKIIGKIQTTLKKKAHNF